VALAAVALLAAPAANAAGTTFYVSPAGTGSTCTQPSPCSLGEALGKAKSGDTVVMAGNLGTYATAMSPLTEAVIVPDGVTLTGDRSGAMPVLYSADEAVNYAGVKLEGSSAKLDYLDIEYSGAGAALKGSGSVDRVIAHGGCFFGINDTTVTNSVCSANYAIFDDVGGSSSVEWTVTLRNDTIYGETEALTLISNGPKMTFNITNTIIHSGGSTDIFAAQLGVGYVWVNTYNSNYAHEKAEGGAHVPPAGSGTNQSAVPLFVDAAHNNLMEAAGSPTIGAGENNALNGMLDLAGAPREIASRTDIGAYEFVYQPVVTVLAPSAVTMTAATVNATINPNGIPASYHVDYGASTAYGASTPTQELTAGLVAQPVALALSGLQPGTTYHYRVVATNSGGTSSSVDQTVTTGAAPVIEKERPPTGERIAPLLALSQSAGSWREGSKLARFSRRHRAAPIGTTFSFTLNEAASVSLVFSRQLPGRRVKGRCVAQKRSNRHARACKRTVTQATLALSGRAGTDKLAFQGRISAKRKLPLGRYTLTATATSFAGLRSAPRSLSFTIVK
jgi:hypothetical protein